MNIGIAPAIDTDIPSIQHILSHGLRSKMYRGDLAWGETVIDEARLQALVAEDIVYLARTEKAILAVFMLFWDDPARWGSQPPVARYLHRFVVAPGLRGQNIGGHIIDLICAEVARHDRQYLRLACPSGNKQLQAYHLQNGFIRADHKATPAHMQESTAYFERSVIDTIQDTQISAKKQSFFGKLQRHFGQKYT